MRYSSGHQVCATDMSACSGSDSILRLWSTNPTHSRSKDTTDAKIARHHTSHLTRHQRSKKICWTPSLCFKVVSQKARGLQWPKTRWLICFILLAFWMFWRLMAQVYFTELLRTYLRQSTPISLVASTTLAIILCLGSGLLIFVACF